MTDIAVSARIQADAKQLVQEMARARASVTGVGETAVQAGARAQKGLSQIGVGADLARRQIDLAKAALVGFISIQAVARGAADLRERADGYANLTAKIKLASDGQVQYRAAEAEVFAISQRTSSQLETTATLYSRLYAALKDQGAGQEEVLGLTETISKSFAVSGATASEAAGAIQQLGQAMAAGALRGDEFNSVNEQAPRLMQALANSLGVTRGKLREMAEAGELSAEKLRRAFSGKEAQKIAEEYAKLPLTIERSFAQLDNSITRYVGQANEASGASAVVAAAVQGVSNNVGVLATGAGVLAALLAGKLTASLVAVAQAKAAAAIQAERLSRAEAIESAAAQANITTQVGKARAVAATGAAVFAKIAVENGAALAEGRAMSITRAATVAASAKAVAIRGVSSALSLMGGPVGIAVAAISILVAKMISASAEAKQLKADIAAAFADSESLLDDPSTPAKSFSPILKQLKDTRRKKQTERDNIAEAAARAAATQARGGSRAGIPDQSAELKQADIELAQLDKRIKAVTGSMVDKAVAEGIGTETTRQAARTNADFTKKLADQTRQHQLATIEATQGYRAAKLQEAVWANNVKSVDELSAATIASVDAEVKAKLASDAATDSKKKGAKASHDAASATKKNADELKRLTEAQREFRDSTAQLQANARGELFGADERLKQQIAGANREGSTSKVSDADVRANVAALTADAQRQVQQLIESGRIQLLQGTGEIVEAATAEATQKYQQTIDYMVATGNTAGEAIYRRLFNVDVAKAQLAELQQVVDQAFSELQRKEQSLQTQVQTGSLTDYEARQKLIQLYRDHAAVVQDLIPKMDALAHSTGDQQSIERVRQLRGELEQLNATTGIYEQQFGQTFQGAFASELEGLATRAKTLGEAVSGFFADISSGLARMASQALAQAAWNRILALFKGGAGDSVSQYGQAVSQATALTVATGIAAAQWLAAVAAASAITAQSGAGGGGSGGVLSALVQGGLAAFGYSEGGPTPPGGKYQPAGIVHAGEYVHPQETVRYYGLDFLRAIHMRQFPRFGVPRVSAPTPRNSFAEGGFVRNGEAAKPPSVHVRVVNTLDADQLLQHISSIPAFEHAIVNAVVRNPNAIRHALDG